LSCRPRQLALLSTKPPPKTARDGEESAISASCLIALLLFWQLHSEVRFQVSRQSPPVFPLIPLKSSVRSSGNLLTCLKPAVRQTAVPVLLLAANHTALVGQWLITRQAVWDSKSGLITHIAKAIPAIQAAHAQNIFLDALISNSSLSTGFQDPSSHSTTVIFAPHRYTSRALAPAFSTFA